LSTVSMSSPWPTQRQWYHVLHASHLIQRSFSKALRTWAWSSTQAGQDSSLSWEAELLLCSGVLERLMDDGGGEVWVDSCVSSFFAPCRLARAISAFKNKFRPPQSVKSRSHVYCGNSLYK
jgi:hypothetical protein